MKAARSGSRRAKEPPDWRAHVSPDHAAIRSQGQWMLLQVSGSLADIAGVVGAASAQSVLDWRNGARQPTPAARARMEATLGIPVAAWTQTPDFGANGNGHSTPPPSSAPKEPGTTLEDCLTLLTLIQRDRSAPNLLPGERVRLADTEAKILKLRAELEARAELSEARYVREHPAWIRARNAISAALKPHPVAAEAVASALDELGL